MEYPMSLYRSVSAIALFLIVWSSSVNAEMHERKLEVIGMENFTNQNLAVTVVEYYEAESKRDWSTTYAARPFTYRKLVPFETYKRDMEQATTDWKLKKIEILESSQLKNGDTQVKIRFYDEFGPQAAQIFFGGKVSHGVNRRIESTTWRQVDNGWLCIDAGRRGHLPY